MFDLTDVKEFVSTECPHLYSVFIPFLQKENTLAYESNQLPDSSVQKAINTMNRYRLILDCFRAVKIAFSQEPAAPDKCNKCRVYLQASELCAYPVCHSCGLMKKRQVDETFSYYQHSTYNRNPIHHYSAREHFHQVLLDFSNTGNATVPQELMDAMEQACGRGPTVSHAKVFRAMKETKGKYRQYYPMQYQIANRLRGSPEFVFCGADVENAKRNYDWYLSKMERFMRRKKIGKFSKRGKLRLYWPVRFMLKRVLINIGRGDLTKFVSPVVSKKRLKEYTKYWEELEQEAGGFHGEYVRESRRRLF